LGSASQFAWWSFTLSIRYPAFTYKSIINYDIWGIPFMQSLNASQRLGHSTTWQAININLFLSFLLNYQLVLHVVHLYACFVIKQWPIDLRTSCLCVS
jgi:hypothetical protein